LKLVCLACVLLLEGVILPGQCCCHCRFPVSSS